MEKSTEQRYPKPKSSVFEYQNKVFKRKITLDDLLARKKIYPFHSKYTWEYMYSKWIKENKHLFPKLTRKHTILKQVREDIINTFDKIMLEDMIYNHTIVEMPYRGVYVFISQGHQSKNNDNIVDFKTGMYRVNLSLYYREILHPVVKFKFKTIRLRKEGYAMLRDAIDKGHRYPRYEEVRTFIESQHV